MAYNTGKEWTPAQVSQLRKAVATYKKQVKSGKLTPKQPIKLIAKKFQRTVGSIRSKAYEKKISLNFTGFGGKKLGSRKTKRRRH